MILTAIASPGIDKGALGTGAKRKERLEMEFKSKTRQKHGHKVTQIQMVSRLGISVSLTTAQEYLGVEDISIGHSYSALLVQPVST